jgi:hypothetical protein
MTGPLACSGLIAAQIADVGAEFLIRVWGRSG